MADLTRRDFFKLAAALGTSLALSKETVARAASDQVPSRVLWLSWDGADWRSVSAMVQAGELPNFAHLQASSGQLHAVRLECGGCSLTKPGHVEAITGLDYHVTGVLTNKEYAEVPAEWSAFWKVKEAYPDYWAGCIFSKGQHTGGSPGEPWKPLADWAQAGGLDYYFNTTDSITLRETNACLEEALRSFAAPGLLYCHWREPDQAGHRKGMDSDLYLNKLRQLDEALGQAVSTMMPDLVVVYSDHGFNGPGTCGHGNAPDGFLACSRPVEENGVRRDVAYTVMKAMGLPVDTYEPRLNGKDLIIRQEGQYQAGAP